MAGALAAPDDPGKAADRPRALIIAGPTCSGKSALAMDIAARSGGTVINADSMQVYRELRILTARPSLADESRVPHALYGVRQAAQASSAAWWRGAALAAMEQARAAGSLPILCGGTGLYFRALTEGLADIPDPGEAARREARDLLQALGPEALHRELAALDPVTASRLKPQDSQRIARAWEVMRGTGRGLAAWQDNAARNPAPWSFRAILLDPPRQDLKQAILPRFRQMIADGAMAEIRALRALDLDPALPVMRAHGVPELLPWAAAPEPPESAIASACAATGRYTKRQATWFRHHELAPESATRRIVARYATPEQFNEADRAGLWHFLFDWIDAPQRGA